MMSSMGPKQLKGLAQPESQDYIPSSLNIITDLSPGLNQTKTSKFCEPMIKEINESQMSDLVETPQKENMFNFEEENKIFQSDDFVAPILEQVPLSISNLSSPGG